MESKFHDLPVELQAFTMGWLPARDICIASSVCRHWYAICNSDSVWRRCWQLNIGEELLPIENEQSMKEVYKKHTSFRQYKVWNGAWVVQIDHRRIFIGKPSQDASRSMLVYLELRWEFRKEGYVVLQAGKATPWQVDPPDWNCVPSELLLDWIRPISSAELPNIPTLTNPLRYGDFLIHPTEALYGGSWGRGLEITHPKWPNGMEIQIVEGSNGWLNTRGHLSPPTSSITLSSHDEVPKHKAKHGFKDDSGSYDTS